MKKSKDNIDGLDRGYYGTDDQSEAAEFLKPVCTKQLYGDLKKTVGQHARVGSFDGGQQE
jgi:hypothetical protein